MHSAYIRIVKLFQVQISTYNPKVSFLNMLQTITSQSDVTYKQLLDTMQTPIMLLNKELVFEYVNPGYTRLVSKESAELLGRYVFDAFPESEEAIAPMREAFQKTLSGETIIMDEQPYSIMDADGVTRKHIWRIVNRPLRDEAGNVKYLLQEAEDITATSDMKRQRNIISNELDHRVKNLLAVINAIINLSGSNSKDIPDFRRSLADRLQAISKSHERLAKSDWKGLELKDVLHDALQPFCDTKDGNITISGPPVKLAMRSTRDASMLFHEFATNAVKYGFLSHPDGRLNVQWTINPETHIAEFKWTESGLNGIQTPIKTGFGSILSESFPNMKVTKIYRPEGLEISILVSEEILAQEQ
jgi:PAS domain S-box-containing protein